MLLGSCVLMYRECKGCEAWKKENHFKRLLFLRTLIQLKLCVRHYSKQFIHINLFNPLNNPLKLSTVLHLQVQQLDWLAEFHTASGWQSQGPKNLCCHPQVLTTSTVTQNPNPNFLQSQTPTFFRDGCHAVIGTWNIPSRFINLSWANPTAGTFTADSLSPFLTPQTDPLRQKHWCSGPTTLLCPPIPVNLNPKGLTCAPREADTLPQVMCSDLAEGRTSSQQGSPRSDQQTTNHGLAGHSTLWTLRALWQCPLSPLPSLYHHSEVNIHLPSPFLGVFLFNSNHHHFYVCKILKEQIERYSERIYIFLL